MEEKRDDISSSCGQASVREAPTKDKQDLPVDP